jgi:aryl-alcohol dehydrogenase-like predicted oxidoreductase
MIKRCLSSTDMTISVVGLGLFAAGGWMWGEQDDADSIAAIHAALEAGVNWVDTAPIYGSGRATAVLAKALAELPAAHRPLVFTKFGHHLNAAGERVTCGSRAQAIADCEANLKVLGVERLDLFQLHWPSPEPIEETAKACEDLLKAGKIRAIGVSNFSVAQLDAWAATGVPLHSVQNQYSLMKPEGAIEADWCGQHGVGFLAHSPLFRGLLSGTWPMDKTFPAGDHRGQRPDFQQPRLARWLQAIEAIRALGVDDEQSVAQLAIGYLLCTEGLTACIVGARNAAQGAALGDLGRPLKQTEMDAIDTIMAAARHDLGPI